MPRSKPSVIVLAMFCLSLLTTTSAFAEDINFNRQIRPILNAHCIACHGPDEADRQADLRLDTFEGATEYAIEPGDADASEIVERITTDDEDLRMPPVGHGDALSAAEIEVIKQWIAQGANYQTHWSFAPVRMPTVPVIESEPALRVYNPIDNFIINLLSYAVRVLNICAILPAKFMFFNTSPIFTRACSIRLPCSVMFSYTFKAISFVSFIAL